VITGEFFHNPEYFRWLNEGGNPEDIFHNDEGAGRNCDESVNFHRIRDRFGSSELAKQISYWVRLSNHIAGVDLRKYTYDPIEYNRASRVLFMLGNIQEDTLKDIVQKNEKKQEKYTLYHDGLYNLKTTINNMINNLTNTHAKRAVIPQKDTKIVIDRLVKMVGITNNSLKDISRLYKCVVPIIDTHDLTVRTTKF
jgi:hypothetical protein